MNTILKDKNYYILDSLEIGNNISILMKQNNLKVTQLKNLLGLKSGRTIRYWLEGARTPSLDNLAKMVVIFNCKYRDILYADECVNYRQSRR